MIDLTKDVFILKVGEFLDIAANVMAQDPELLEMTAKEPALVLFGFIYLSKILDKISPLEGNEEKK